MKRIFVAISIVLALQSFTITGNELTKEERASAAAYLTETRDYFTSHVKGLSDAQLDFKAGPDKWSIRQCIEHIALSENFILTLVEGSVKSPANADKRSEVKFTDDQLKAALINRTKKGQAPEPIRPGGKFTSADEAVQSFLKARDTHIAYIETTKDELRDHLTPHPFFGMMDAYQWIILISGHTKRHTLQIEEVMASPGFPKS